jgi:hypothetical protein
MEMKVENKLYIVDKSRGFSVPIQRESSGVKVYGFSVEVRPKDTFKFGSSWNDLGKLYSTHGIALDAIIKMRTSAWRDFDLRIIPLYRMESQEFRQFKINQILSDKDQPDLSDIVDSKVELEFFVSGSDFDWGRINKKVIRKGSVVCKLGSSYYLIEGPTKKVSTLWVIGDLINIFDKNFSRVDLESVRYVIPHLPKIIKEKLRKS